MVRIAVTKTSDLYFSSYGHFCATWVARGWKNPNLQLNSMIGGDSYVFNLEKSIAKCFQTFLSCQVPFLATFVPLAWHGMRLEEFKIAIQLHDWYRFLSVLCWEIDYKCFQVAKVAACATFLTHCAARVWSGINLKERNYRVCTEYSKTSNLYFSSYMARPIRGPAISSKSNRYFIEIMLGIVFHDTWNRRVKVR